ncbi:hypothetical protein JIN85_10700 [Luteolibacter pohnpeiensis]|uniref:Uncharacterized protein n=1 Tax=Luteolibacter pohnpeiensis TaxID=454153 RepID=A0A934S614_9BACT|nr:hypothetical protein [Luteolibacter pohnpeiensis]MBK1882887.1 hypothetical protein [Luteolibacter pohnpeiensis]
MKPSVEQLGNLLALKREIRPEEAYWQDFLCEFHQRQREQAVKKSGLSGMIGSVVQWFSEMGPSKWAYGAGLAYAAVTIGYFLSPPSPPAAQSPTTPVHRVVEPTQPVQQLQRLDLSPTTEGETGEQVF